MVEQLDVTNAPKKRGRKPKNLSIEEKVEEKIPKKRGRKPKIKDNNVPKIPKKRGRKPKDSTVSKTLTNNIDLSIVKDTILHLKTSSTALDNNLLLDNLYNYDPEINEPQPYDPSNNDLEIIGDLNNNQEIINKDTFLVNEKKETENNEEKDTNEMFEQKLTNLNNRYSESTTNCFVNNTSIKKKNISPIMMYYNEYNKR